MEPSDAPWRAFVKSCVLTKEQIAELKQMTRPKVLEYVGRLEHKTSIFLRSRRPRKQELCDAFLCARQAWIICGRMIKGATNMPKGLEDSFKQHFVTNDEQMEAITPRLRPFFLDFTTSPVATSGGGDGAPTEDTASMRTADGALKPKPPSGKTKIGLLITARQVLAAVTQRLTVVIIDFREAKPNHIQSESDHLRLIFIDPRRISHMSELRTLLYQTKEPDTSVLKSLGNYFMVVLMGDDEEQHHANIEDYRKKSKPRLIFEILQKYDINGSIPKRLYMLADGFPGLMGAFPDYVSNTQYIYGKPPPLAPAPSIWSVLKESSPTKPKAVQPWLVEVKVASAAVLHGKAASRTPTPTSPPKPAKQPAPKTTATAPKVSASAAALKAALAAPSSSPPLDQPSALKPTPVATTTATDVDTTAAKTSNATAERSMKRKSPEPVSTMDTKRKPTAPTTSTTNTRASRKDAAAAQLPPLPPAKDAKIQKSLLKRDASPDDLAVTLSHATLDSPVDKGTAAKEADTSGRAMPEQPPSESDGIPKGLHNFGNTCYANALLQSMFHAGKEFCDATRTYLQQLVAEEQTKGLVVNSLPITRAFLRIQKYRCADDDTHQARCLEKFLEKVREHSSARFPAEGGFPGHKQHDPHEFLVQVMDFMQRELVDTVRDVLDKVPLTPDHTDRFFKHTIAKTYTCDWCGFAETKHTDGNHFIMTLANTNQDTTASLLRRTVFDAESEFDEEADRKKCLQCRRVPTSTPLGFKLLPPVLILTVKRYLILGGEKLTESVRPSHYIAVGTADPVPLSPPRRAAPQPSPSRDGSPPRKSPRKDAEVSSSGVDAAADLNVSANTTGSLDAEEIPGDKFHAYNPVDHTWRDEWCRKLFRRDYERDVDALVDPYEIYNFTVDRQQFWYRTDEEPAHRADVEGDGNCLFRSFAHLLTAGSEDNHQEIRSTVCDFIEEHPGTFEELYLAKQKEGEAEFADYLRKMREDGTWGTELEIFAFATLTQTPVASFHKGRWHVHQPRFKLVDGEKQDWTPSPDQPTVFIHNEGNVHFSPVVSVPAKQLYEIRSVVNHRGMEIGSGHYIAYLRMKTGKWVQCNDAFVDAMDDPSYVLRDCADDGYLYLYAKSDATPNTFSRTPFVPEKLPSSSRSALFG